MLKLQQTIMQNSQGIQDYLTDLRDWTQDIKKKEIAVVYNGKPQP